MLDIFLHVTNYLEVSDGNLLVTICVVRTISNCPKL